MGAQMEFTHEESIEVAATPAQVYGLVSDVTRTGEWSPVCVRCTWADGDGPSVGARFTGFNEVPGRSWQTTCEVVAAEPGREFAWVVNGGLVRWGYTLHATDGGTRLTESWDFTEAGRAYFHDRYGDTAEAEIANRTRVAHDGIPATLAAIKRVAEAR